MFTFLTKPPSGTSSPTSGTSSNRSGFKKKRKPTTPITSVVPQAPLGLFSGPSRPSESQFPLLISQLLPVSQQTYATAQGPPQAPSLSNNMLIDNIQELFPSNDMSINNNEASQALQASQASVQNNQRHQLNDPTMSLQGNQMHGTRTERRLKEWRKERGLTPFLESNTRKSATKRKPNNGNQIQIGNTIARKPINSRIVKTRRIETSHNNATQHATIVSPESIIEFATEEQNATIGQIFNLIDHLYFPNFAQYIIVNIKREIGFTTFKTRNNQNIFCMKLLYKFIRLACVYSGPTEERRKIVKQEIILENKLTIGRFNSEQRKAIKTARLENIDREIDERLYAEQVRLFEEQSNEPIPEVDAFMKLMAEHIILGKNDTPIKNLVNKTRNSMNTLSIGIFADTGRKLDFPTLNEEYRRGLDLFHIMTARISMFKKGKELPIVYTTMGGTALRDNLYSIIYYTYVFAFYSIYYMSVIPNIRPNRYASTTSFSLAWSIYKWARQKGGKRNKRTLRRRQLSRKRHTRRKKY